MLIFNPITGIILDIARNSYTFPSNAHIPRVSLQGILYMRMDLKAAFHLFLSDMRAGCSAVVQTRIYAVPRGPKERSEAQQCKRLVYI